MPRSLHLAVLVLLLVAGCQCGSEVNRGDLNIVPLDQEWMMGEQVATQALQQVDLVEDPAVQQYVDRMGQELVAATELAERPWRFYVVDDPSINAFALPGGHVFVHTGLIEAAGSPSELASVVGHEVAHVAARHHTERITKVYGLNTLASLLVGQDVSLAEQIAVQLVGSGTLAKFSRDDERESDELGQALMAEAGYPPQAMAGMFRTMLEARERRPNLLERFFASHPITEERIQTAEERAQALPEVEERAARPETFTQVQRRIAAPAAERATRP